MQFSESLYLRELAMPYVEIKNGEHYCSLCWSVATEGHFSSAKHQRKVDWWVKHVGPNYGLVPGKASLVPAQMQQPDAEVHDIIALEKEPWIILRSRGGDDVPYCTLCNRFAEEAHLLSSMHQTRRKYPQHYGYNAALLPPPPPPQGPPSPPPSPPQGPTPDFPVPFTFPPPPQGPPPEPKPVYYSSPSVCPMPEAQVGLWSEPASVNYAPPPPMGLLSATRPVYYSSPSVCPLPEAQVGPWPEPASVNYAPPPLPKGVHFNPQCRLPCASPSAGEERHGYVDGQVSEHRPDVQRTRPRAASQNHQHLPQRSGGSIDGVRVPNGRATNHEPIISEQHPTHSTRIGRAKANFDADEFGREYISLKAGSRIEISDPRMEEGGWLYGSSGGRRGWFPREYFDDAEESQAFPSKLSTPAAERLAQTPSISNPASSSSAAVVVGPPRDHGEDVPPPQPPKAKTPFPTPKMPSVDCPPPQDTTTWSQVFSVPPQTAPRDHDEVVPPPPPPKARQLLLSQRPAVFNSQDIRSRTEAPRLVEVNGVLREVQNTPLKSSSIIWV